ncbi:MAG: class I SAM-dependent methyltransferase [Oceanospirillaceae bacterium]|nr:class I SAM-dependent methyltransferase [Oceanospirillaceae bacterium]
MKRVMNKISSLTKQIIPIKQYINVSGSIIPSPDRRWCGPEFKDDNFYLMSAENEAKRLIENFHCTPKSRVLDLGCGQGRLPIGIIRLLGHINYTGIDIDRNSVNWCKKHIEKAHPSFHFKYLDLYNERYNRKGIKIDENFRFDIESKSIDIIYLFSVFSHTTENDMRSYLKEFLRILDNEGKVFFTTFVEDDVPNISINPENYKLQCTGPLHIVRYQKEYLFSILDEYGYSIQGFTHGTEADGQSGIYLSIKT